MTTPSLVNLSTPPTVHPDARHSPVVPIPRWLFAPRPIASGTYGFIYPSKADPERFVYKVSPVPSLSVPDTTCAPGFEFEYIVSVALEHILKRLSTWFEKEGGPALRGSKPSEFMRTEALCIFRMIRLHPIQRTNPPTLIELLPGGESTARRRQFERISHPLTGEGAWTKAYAAATKALLDNKPVPSLILPSSKTDASGRTPLLPGWSYASFCRQTGRLAAVCAYVGIGLNDVEFMIASEYEGVPSVYLIDFDKVHVAKIPTYANAHVLESYRTRSFMEWNEWLHESTLPYESSVHGIAFSWSFTFLQFPHNESEFNDAYSLMRDYLCKGDGGNSFLGGVESPLQIALVSARSVGSEQVFR
jgi:hypothetical protein